MLMNWLMAQYSKASVVSPVGQPFSSTGAPPDEVLWVGDQLHISNSACTIGWREGLSLGNGEEGGLRIVGRWSTVAERGCTSPHAQQLCLTLVLCASTSVTSSSDSAATLQTAKRPRRSSL